MNEYRQCDVCGHLEPIPKCAHSITIDETRFWACDRCAGLLIEQLSTKKKVIFEEKD